MLVNGGGGVAGLDEKLHNGGGELVDLDSAAAVGVLGGDVGVDLISHIQLESTSIVRMLAALSSIASWPSLSEAPRQVVFILDSGSLTSAAHSSPAGPPSSFPAYLILLFFYCALSFPCMCMAKPI